jgi:hypothetical protein
MLDNKHLVFLMLSGVMIEKFEIVLAREDLPLEFKELLEHYIDVLKTLKTTGSEAGALLNATKELIYAKVNADEKHFEGLQAAGPGGRPAKALPHQGRSGVRKIRQGAA